MADTIAFGNILTDDAATWLSSPVTQQDKVDNPITVPAPTAADAAERATAKVANTIFKALEDLNAFFQGDTAAGSAGALLRLLDGLRIADAASVVAGNGSPEGVVTALVGSVYLRLDGGPDTVLYMKEAGTGNTGWTAYAAAGGGNPARKDIIPGQNIVGTDTVLATNLSFAPDSNSLALFLNGAEQVEGQHYSLSGVAITWLAGSGTAVDLDPLDQITAYYRG